MSHAQLGKKLGVAFQQVQKYENGKNRVGASRLQMISTALDVPVGQFFTDGAGTSRTSAKPLAFDPQALRFAEAFIRLNDRALRNSILIWLSHGEKIASYLTWRGRAPKDLTPSVGNAISGFTD